MALVTRFCTTCCKRTLSPQTGRKQSVSARRVTPFWAASLWQAAQTAAIEGWRAIDRATWGERSIYPGEAPQRDLPKVEK